MDLQYQSPTEISCRADQHTKRGELVPEGCQIQMQILNEALAARSARYQI